MAKQSILQRQIGEVQPQQQNKKLYYLQFLSGQPVWGLVKKNQIDNLNNSSQTPTGAPSVHSKIDK
jgi:hypothetical protein